jgi:hypothetical protein
MRCVTESTWYIRPRSTSQSVPLPTVIVRMRARPPVSNR